ncbi:MAG: hypothetical protein D3909_07765, partial [Candidatus Electrothrix sp. ATG1]|nr:hypothetical protein [Candidatus Electrothrix sp. ATG1]
MKVGRVTPRSYPVLPYKNSKAARSAGGEKMTEQMSKQQTGNKKGVSLKQVLCIVTGAMLLTILLTIFAIKTWLFPSPFTPVELSQKEEQQLEQKLSRFDAITDSPSPQNQNQAPANTRTRSFTPRPDD